jgi:hypothetical protein
VLAARTSINATAVSLRTNKVAACKGHPLSRRCERARRRERRFRRLLTHERLNAAHAYYAKIELGRSTFWREIRALRGGPSEPADKPIPLQNS